MTITHCVNPHFSDIFDMDPATSRLLLCASGSVATVKVPEIAVRLSQTAEVCLLYSGSMRQD